MRWVGLFFLLVGFSSCTTSGTPAVHVPPAPADRVALVRPVAEQAARDHGVPVELVLGVIRVESSFNPRARSSVGACGLMQLMPQTARSLARRLGREDYDVYDPEFNVQAGTAYLAFLLKMFQGDLHLALAGYNSGPYRVLRWAKEGRSLPPYSRRYVAAVLSARSAFAKGQGAAEKPAATRAADRPATPRSLKEDNTHLDRQGLSDLVRQQKERYGHRPDVPLPEDQLPEDQLPEDQSPEN